MRHNLTGFHERSLLLPRDEEVQQLIGVRCKKEGISVLELEMGVRRGGLPRFNLI